MKEIADMQDKIYASVFSFATMGKEDKLNHVTMLQELLNKQQVLYTRMSLSDDPEAKNLKDQILTSAQATWFSTRCGSSLCICQYG